MRQTNCICLTTVAAKKEEEQNLLKIHTNKTKDCKTYKIKTKIKLLEICNKSLSTLANATKETVATTATTTATENSVISAEATVEQPSTRIPSTTTIATNSTTGTRGRVKTFSTTSCRFSCRQIRWWHHQHYSYSLIATLILLFVCTIIQSTPALNIQASKSDIYKNLRLGHRIVQTRYGRLHGLILPLDNYRFLRSVEVFLGVPYATPPTKQNRFSPTRAPAPWDGIRISDTYSPVCPQRLPNIQNETAALEKMPKGRLEYLKRLMPHLENQSEDCLYLNIFSPINASLKTKYLHVRTAS